MIHEIRVSPAAERQIRRAAEWWLENRPKARGAFAEDLERAFQLVSTMPSSGQPVQHPRHQAIRRLLMGRVRYFLYYRFDSVAERVDVIALWHANREGEPALEGQPVTG